MMLVSFFAKGMSFSSNLNLHFKAQNTTIDSNSFNKINIHYSMKQLSASWIPKTLEIKKKQTEWNDTGNSIKYIRKCSNKLAKN